MRDKILEITRETIETLGYLCVEAKIQTGKTRSLKIIIYKKGADVSMGDCSEVSSVLLRRLEVDFPEFSEQYDMTVESPGVDRKLLTMEEVILFSDREMRFVFRTPQNYGLKDNVLVGKVVETKDNELIIKSEQGQYQIPFSDFSTIKLHFDIKKYL